MVYVDTSVLVAYYCPEPLSGKAEAFLISQDKPVISTLTEVELFAALSRKVREARMTRVDAGRVASKFMSHLDHTVYTRLPVNDHHYRLARDWMGLFRYPLRTLDALHLAVASSENLKLVTIDKNLSKSAKALSIDVMLLA